MSTKSQEIKKKMQDLKKTYLAAAKEEFKEASQSLFDKHSRLKSFGWRQYTPYFCDGDICEFGVRNDEPIINGFDRWDKDEGEKNGEDLNTLARKDIYIDGKWIPNENYDKDADNIVKDVVKFLRSFDYDAYLDMFEDHVMVTVTKTKVITEEYQHD